ncbi:MAG: acetate--CoA ligase family protein [Candidatus Micrarchaeota archaeon]
MEYLAAAGLLKKYNILVVEERLARTEKEALSAARAIGYPVVLKLISRDVVHKVDVGGVRMHVENEGEARRAYAAVVGNAKKIGARVDGVLVQKMARPGLELIVGGKRDEQFGPLVMFGLGGVLVEVMKDFSMRACPVGKEDALEMMGEIKARVLLEGYRGGEPADKNALAELIVKVSKLMYENNKIKELDLNPVIAHRKGYSIVDVRISE